MISRVFELTKCSMPIKNLLGFFIKKYSFKHISYDNGSARFSFLIDMDAARSWMEQKQ